MTQRAPFMPVTPDIDDDKLERLAAEKGVGAMVKPVANGGGEGRPVAASKPTADKDGDAATPCTEFKSLNLDLPLYAWTEIKIRAAQRQTSLKHVVMTALAKDGVTIHEVDMIEDGRRVRGNKG